MKIKTKDSIFLCGFLLIASIHFVFYIFIFSVKKVLHKIGLTREPKEYLN